MIQRPTWLDDNWAMVPIAPKPRSRKIDMLAAEPCDDPDCEICESIRAPYRDEPVRTDPAANELKEYVRQLESERDNLQNALDSMSFTCDLMKQQHSSIVRKSKKQKKRLVTAKKVVISVCTSGDELRWQFAK